MCKKETCECGCENQPAEEKKCECGCGKFKNFVKKHKILSWTVGGIILLLILIRIFLTPIVQTSVSTIAPMITGVPVTIGDVSVGILSGYVALEDVKVGNPEGYKSKNMVHLKKAVFDIDIASLFSDKVIIEEITVDGLNLYYETKFKSSNVSDLQKNVEKNLGTADKKAEEPAKKEKPEAKAEKEESPSEPQKLQVNKILLQDITAHVVISGADIPVMMIPINMENLGTGPEGITAGGIFAAILNKLSMGASDAAVEAFKKGTAATGEALKDIGDKAGNTLKDVGDKAGDTLKDVGNGLKNILKK